MGIYNLISFVGMFVLMGIAWACSTNRRLVNWRVLLWGTGLQLAFAAFIFAVPAGQTVFLFINGLVVKLVEVAGDGARFLFGPLAQPPGTEGSIGFILAFQALPTIVFFAALLSLLYHFRVLPLLVEWFSKLFTRWLRLSGAESLCVTSNIFVGVESALTVKPYLARMTRSELCTIMTAMMGNTASSVLAFYVLILLPTFPNIAGHLVSATLLSWPAGIVMAKLIFPEEEKPETLGTDVKAWQDPSLTSARPAISEESLLARTAMAACSPIPTTSRASWTRTPRISPLGRCSRMRSSWPTSTTSRSNSLTASTDPFTISWGALSPPMASRAILTAMLAFHALSA